MNISYFNIRLIINICAMIFCNSFNNSELILFYFGYMPENLVEVNRTDEIQIQPLLRDEVQTNQTIHKALCC